VSFKALLEKAGGEWEEELPSAGAGEDGSLARRRVAHSGALSRLWRRSSSCSRWILAIRSFVRFRRRYRRFHSNRFQCRLMNRGGGGIGSPITGSWVRGG
jgi:hypothetical protein